jgi:Zn-dependent protease with chaperone function
MDFFAAQAASRRRTRWLLAGYGTAVAAVVVAITWIVLLAGAVLSRRGSLLGGAGSLWHAEPGLALGTAALVLGVIAVASLHRTAQLAGGGAAVALSLGATKVTRETRDPRRRRLLNVVEEMAIASGVPVPQVFVLDQEPAINAFAAGFQPADAAITVTRGAVERLTRAELQGVIGHEFSHVLNGDMRLNTRLAGPLFGLLVIAIAARRVLGGLQGSESRKAGPFVLAALAVMALGYLGVFLGRLLQAAICRQREFLADASSVQFTRDTTGLRDALVRIARGDGGSRLRTPAGEDLAHLFIAPAYQRAFATHPPLAERVAALDPGYDLGELTRYRPDEPDAVDEPLDAAPAWLAPGGVALPADGRLATRVGNPGVDAVRYAELVRAALPAELDAVLARGSTAACAWLAVGLAADATVRARQLAAVRTRLGPAVAEAVERIGTRLATLPLPQRLPFLQRALPALAALPVERRRTLVAVQAELAAADGRIDVLEFLLAALAARYLADQLQPETRAGRPAGLEDVAADLGLLFATLAAVGQESTVDARRAYERGLAPLLPGRRPDYEPPAPDWAGALSGALARLDRLAPVAKQQVVDGLARTVLHDGTVDVREAELVRAACALLHCPLPPLLADAGGGGPL